MYFASNTISSDFFPGGLGIKNMPAIKETQDPSLGPVDSLKKKIVTLSSILAWEIPWTKEPGVLWSMGLPIE